jgi:Bacterial SH3 domain
MSQVRRALSAAIVVIAGCTAESPAPPTAGEASGVPAPEVTPSGASAAPSAGPSPEGAVSDGGLAQVLSDELSLRSEAGTDAELVDTLARGTVVRVESGSTEADGFTWFEVVDVEGRRGWVADGDGEDAWLGAITDLTQAAPSLTLSYGCDVVPPVNPPATTLLDSGLVVARGQADGGEYVVRQLSAAGLDELREGVLESPYLQESADYQPVRRPGLEPPGHGLCVYVFTIATDGEPIAVRTVGWFGDEEESTFYEPSPEREALDSIARNLIDINGILDDEAWESPPLPYVGGDYLLMTEDGFGAPPGGAVEVDTSRFGLGDLASFGTPTGNGRCGTISRADAFEVARVINEADPAAAMGLDAVRTPYFMTGDGWVTMTMAPRFPDGGPDCPPE